MKSEAVFQAGLISELKKRLPGCIVTKLDSAHIQGIPDLLILWGKHWAALECKKHATAKRRPNQQYYIELMDRMSFARFIFPENRENVLNELEQAFRAGGKSRVPFGK